MNLFDALYRKRLRKQLDRFLGPMQQKMLDELLDLERADAVERNAWTNRPQSPRNVKTVARPTSATDPGSASVQSIAERNTSDWSARKQSSS
jgi:hypothetical protein